MVDLNTPQPTDETEGIGGVPNINNQVIGRDLPTISPEDVMSVDDMGDNEQQVTIPEEDKIWKPSDYPKFSSLFQAIRWAKENKEVIRIYYRCLSGRFIIRDVETHGDFWAKTTSRRILVTYDETINDIRGFIVDNIEKYDFKGEKFSLKFNFSRSRKNYKARIRHRKKSKDLL